MNNTENLVRVAIKDGWTSEHDEYLAKNPTLFIELFNMITSVSTGLIENFLKKTTHFVLESTDEEFNVARDIKKFLPTKEEGGKIDVRDENIVILFGDIIVKGRATSSISFVYRFLKNLTHREIISTGEEFKIYKKYNLFDAFALAQKLINTGEIEEECKGILIYLKEQYGGNNYRLRLYRDAYGEVSVAVYRVIVNSGWDTGGGVLFS